MRACEFDGCTVQGNPDEMVRASTGVWYCVPHAAAVTADEQVDGVRYPQLARCRARPRKKTRPLTPVKTLGRCPHCGKSTPVLCVPGQPGEVLEHDCDARACETPGCLVVRLPDEMIQFPTGEWYCPSHALLTAAQALVDLHATRTSHAEIVEILEDVLPGILDRFPH